jgi:hypothetical protein
VTRLGLIVRTDQGGLANQTQQLAAVLRPDAVLAVDLPAHQRRGDSQAHRLGHLPITATAATDSIPAPVLARFAESVDRLVTVECLYAPPPLWQTVNQATTTVLVANPELYADYPAHRIIVPTNWRLDRFPHGATVVPHPVDLTAAAPHARARTGPARTFLHVEAPAMCDRNGSELVAAALGLVTEPCTLIVRSHRDRRSGPLADTQVGNVRIVWDNTRPADWTACYHPADVDVLLLPRRYGGLSMVVQEAAALGIPTVMLDLDPQRAEGWPGWRVPGHRLRTMLMRGGEFDVHTCRPEHLAATVNALARGDLDVGAGSARALAWAHARSWPVVEALWAAALA